MQSIFSNALSRAVGKHIGVSTTRQETLSWLALLIMQHGTISLRRRAGYVASAAQTASVQRRFYRFFQFVRLDGAHSARVVVELFGQFQYANLGANNFLLLCHVRLHCQEPAGCGRAPYG